MTGTLRQHQIDVSAVLMSYKRLNAVLQNSVQALISNKLQQSLIPALLEKEENKC